MVLTEEEKKEYLINYKPQPKWHSELIIFLTAIFTTWSFFYLLSHLGYINLNFSDNLKLLFAGVVGFVCGHIVKYAIRKK